MGLRTASVRRPYVEVMAPALTETTQSQTFKLTTTKDHHHLQPASPINNFNVNYKYCYRTNQEQQQQQQQQQQDNNGTNQCLNDLINESLQIGGAGGGGETCNSNIMNNCQISMDDQQQQQQTTDNMGLEKAEFVNTLTKIQNDNKTNDVDQILNNLTTNLQANDIDLTQNVDDLMQVIKSIENDQQQQQQSNDMNLDENVEIPIPTALTTIEKFFNDVDMMNISIEDQQDIETNNLIIELKSKQAKIERRLDFLLRKIRKLQVRHMGQHVSGEIAGVYEYVHRSLKRLKDVSIHETSIQSTTPIQDDKSTIIINDKLKPMSYGSTKAMLKKLEMTAMLQASTASRQKQLSKYFGSGSYEPTNFRCNLPGVVNIPTWPIEHKYELQKVSGSLHSELNIVQHEIDSEATESSSGGESCDEMQNYNNPHQQYLSIQKRALWKYLTARAAIAARWTWLQAQIADLEYRIRQHTDLYHQLRLSKGEIKLGGASPPSPTHLQNFDHDIQTATTTVNGYRGQLPGSTPISSKLISTSSTTTTTTTTILEDNCTSNNVDGSLTTANGVHFDYQCARTRPLVNFKKRRLVQINGLHAISKKANRPSTIRCGCVQPMVQCAVCTGRTDPTHPRDPSNAFSKSERIALVDSGFHPVFSLPEDISCGIHCDAIMKTPEWQQKSTRMKSLKIMKGERSEKSMLDRTKKLEHRQKKHGRILKSSTTSGLSSKIKHKVRGRKPGRHPSNFKLNNKKRTKLGITQIQGLTSDGSVNGGGGGVDEEVESIGNNSNVASNSVLTSPSSSPLLHMQAVSGYNRRNRTNSYDIDNIVIPYSVAASTRVEKLQYKEIPTPKWRIVEDIMCDAKNNGAVKNPSQDSDMEDLSEDAVIVRHDKCEYEEKKKFLSYLKLPMGHGRSRSHKRTDSLAESSGANTPDPMSPYPLENHDNINSPLITSPPATPLSNNNNNNHNTSSNNSEDSTIPTLPSVSIMRRRTISQSRFGVREKDLNRDENNIYEHIEIIPFDLRIFPLDDETYNRMLASMPVNYQFKTNIKSQDSNDYNYLDDKILSPGSSESTESAVGEEDPNDPEWMDVERSKDRHKR